MPAAAGDQGSGPAGLCPEAGRIEEDMAGLEEEWEGDGVGEDYWRAKIECARAYAACGRRHGEEGRLEEAEECLERAVRLHWMWSECSDVCGRIAARLEDDGRLADAVVWYGKAVQYVDRGRGPGSVAQTDAQREKKHRKRRSKWASECIRCWDALAGGAPQQQRQPQQEAGLDAPYRAADLAAAGDDKRRASLRVQVGDAELGRGRCGSAAEWYYRAMEIDPWNERAALGAGRALEQDGRWAVAVSQYKRAADAIPRLRKECAAGCARCARSLMSAGSPGDALPAIELAAERDVSHALECARMHHGRGDALEKQRQGGGGQADDAAVALHYTTAVIWYHLADEPAEAARETARCARRLLRMGLTGEALFAIEEAAKRDASHALACARMYRDRADVLVQWALERGEPDAGAAAEGSAEQGPSCGATAAAHYGTAVEWYGRAAREGVDARVAAEAARGCARCARGLGLIGLAGEALSAIEAAAGLDASHALKCARMHRRRADALAAGAAGAGAAAGQDGAKGGHDAGKSAAEGRPADQAAAAAAQYGRAVEWYRRAAKAEGGAAEGRAAAEAARGCARCARGLGRTGHAGEALSAIEAAAEIDGAAYALECGARCRLLADGLAGGGTDMPRDAKRMYDRALEHYNAAAAAAAAGGPNAQRALLGSAAVCIKLGLYARAAEAFGAAYELKGAGVDGGLRAECVDGICECACMLAAAGDSKGVGRCLELKAMAGARSRSRCAKRCSAMGRAEHEAGRYEKAASCLAAAVSIDDGNGGDPDVRFYWADSLSRMGRHDEAVEQYEAAMERGGDAPMSLLAMAGSHEAAGRRGQAAACLARAAEADRTRAAECAGRCSAMGRAEHEAGRYEQAASCFATAVSIDGNDTGARSGLAGSLARLGRHDEALEQYEAAVERGGDSAGARSGLAGSLARLGRHDEAVEQYEAAVERGGDAPLLLLAMAGSHEAAGRRGQAAACLARAAEADRTRAAECAGRCSAMGRAEHEAGRYEQAASCFATAVSIDGGGGGDAAARLGLADSWRMAGRRADALREYSGARRSGDAGQRARAYAGIARILAAESRHMDAAGLACMAARAARARAAAADANPDGIGACRAECSEICTECGDALREQGMHDDAYACYARALSIDPGSAGANCGIGDHMARQGLLRDALVRYEAALEADGDMARALAGAGRMRCSLAGRLPTSEGRRGYYPGAEALFERALEIDPGDFEARMGAGWACLGQKAGDKLDAAVSHFCAAAAARPGDAGARMAAGKALRKLARFYAKRDMHERAADCHRRAIAHYEHAMSSPGPGGGLEPGYWKAVCMLHLGLDWGQARSFMEGVLERARPQDRALLDFCGRICDVLGSYGTACYYYMESLPGSGLYTDGFHGRIDMARVDTGGAAAVAAKGDAPAGRRRRRGAAAGTAGRAGMRAGGGAAEGDGAPPVAAAAAAVYVLDANVVVKCAEYRAEGPDPDIESVLVEGIRRGDCRIPQAALDEAYGVVHNKKDGDLGALLQDWGARIESIKDHRRMDLCMKRAREAMMTAWLYSSIVAKAGWRRRKFGGGKFGGGKAPYTGGPPGGMDVVILATAAHLADEPGGQGPRRVILVTSDADFLVFRDYIREALSVDVETPDDAARMLASAALERERQAELGRRAGGEGRG